MIKLFLVDLTKKGRFYAQLECVVITKQIKVGNQLLDQFDLKDVIDQIEENYPSLRGKDYRIHFNAQKVINV